METNNKKIIDTTAGIISAISSPLLCPVYAIIIAMTQTFLIYASPSARLSVIIASVAITLALPVILIFILYRVKIVKTPSLSERRDRTIPLIGASVCYAGMAFYLYSVHAPMWLIAFMLGAAATAVVTMVVNFKWKISGHATAMGGLCALTFFLTMRGFLLQHSDTLFIITILIAGIVMTARLILKCHSLLQIIAGFASGALIISLSQIISE